MSAVRMFQLFQNVEKWRSFGVTRKDCASRSLRSFVRMAQSHRMTQYVCWITTCTVAVFAALVGGDMISKLFHSDFFAVVSAKNWIYTQAKNWQ